jgi:hypothetical protein
MRFSWTSLLLAPLLVPLMFSAVFPEFVRYEQPGTLVPNPDDTELHHLLRHDDVPLPTRAVSSFPVAAADGPERLPAGPGAGCGGVRYGSRLCENALEPRMHRIVFSIAFFRQKLPIGFRIDEIETEILHAS